MAAVCARGSLYDETYTVNTAILNANPVFTGNITCGKLPAGSVISGTYGAADTLANADGSVANGNWTLFFANLPGGGANGELTNSTLNLTAVPEPVGMGLGIFGGLLALWWFLGIVWKRQLSPLKPATRLF